MICYWRRFTWIVSGLRLPRQRFTPTLRPPWASQRLPRHLARPMGETTTSVATKTSITTKNCTSGNGGGNNNKNSNGSGGRGGSSGQTTAPTGSDGRTNAPRPTYGHPWQGHVTMYPTPCPLDSRVRRPSWAHRASTHLPAPVRATAAAAAVPASRPSPWMEPLARRKLGPTGTDQLLQHHGAPPRPLALSRTGWRTPARRTTPLHQLIIFLLFIIWLHLILHLSL
jgi:hypothetical protein